MVLCRLAVKVQGRSVDSLIELDKAVIRHLLVCCENR